MTGETLPPIPAAYIERAARAYYDTAGVHWDTLATSDQEAAAACLTAAIEAFLQLVVPEMLEAAMHTARGLVAEEIAQAIEFELEKPYRLYDESAMRALGLAANLARSIANRDEVTG